MCGPLAYENAESIRTVVRQSSSNRIASASVEMEYSHAGSGE
jgi:hypothetical protein